MNDGKVVVEMAEIKSEIAEILDGFMVIVGIFALIFAASGDWGRFVLFLMVATGMIYFSAYLKR